MGQQDDNAARCLPEKKKMEALGRLSGKVAHDLNNILGAIEGYATLAMSAVKEGDPLRDDLQEIRTAVAKAAAFNRQLLIFSGRQMLRKEACAIGALIDAALKNAPGAPGDNCKIELNLQPGLPDINCDREQLAQALLKLLANAREAMSGGGTVTIGASALRLERAAASVQNPEEAGLNFVKISVKDTGPGLDGGSVEHLFEPAFPAKVKKHGGGLGGLAYVYGVVKQHNGWVEAASAPGRGSEFLLFLPVSSNK